MDQITQGNLKKVRLSKKVKEGAVRVRGRIGRKILGKS